MMSRVVGEPLGAAHVVWLVGECEVASCALDSAYHT